MGLDGEGEDKELGLGEDGESGAEDGRVGGDAVCEPDVAADDGAVADVGVAAEYGGAGVDDDVVADFGVAVDAFDGVAIVADGDAFGTEGDALIYFDMGANDGGLADYDAGAVVDEEVISDGGAGVNVNAGAAVGIFCHDAGDVGYAEGVDFVC